MGIGEVFMFVFKDPHDTMIIDKSILEKITGLGTIPLLWCRDGEYCVIPKEVVQNAISVVNSFSYMSDETMHPEVHIQWSQGIPINNQAGRALVGE